MAERMDVAIDSSRSTNPDQKDETGFSIFASKFDITPSKSNASRWNKDWEKLLSSLSSRDVYSTFALAIKGQDSSSLIGAVEEVTKKLHGFQTLVTDLWKSLQEEGHFATAWLLVDEVERKCHLLKGIQEACQMSPLREDVRAFCPEITVSAMLKQGGQAFIDFITAYTNGKNGASGDAPYLMESEWWQEAVKDLTNPSDASVFRVLTLARNEFIAYVVMQSMMSVLHDLSNGSPGMDPVVEMMKSDGEFARVWGKTLAGRRERPITRCESCEKGVEELGNVKWMVCSGCKVKLGFIIHYCSQACQKEDWRNHKKQCGKQKKSKRLRGTIHDPLWAHPQTPDWLSSTIPSSDDTNGNILISQLGFGNLVSSGSSQIQDSSHSPALKRQLSLLTADTEAEYYLFDDLERPVRVITPDTFTKMTFRILRSDALASNQKKGLEALAEYMIKTMGSGQRPGLTREGILNQLGKEYGCERDLEMRVAEFEKMAAKNGFTDGETFLEVMSKGLAKGLPRAGFNG